MPPVRLLAKQYPHDKEHERYVSALIGMPFDHILMPGVTESEIGFFPT